MGHRSETAASGASGAARRGRAIPLAIACVLGLSLCLPAAAFIPIDRFRDPQMILLPSGTPSAFESASETGPGGVIAGKRDVDLRRSPSDAPGDITLEVAPNGIERLFLDDEEAAVELTLVYDGPDGLPAIDPTGLGSIDLTEAGTDERFSIRLRSDTASNVAFQVFDSGSALGERWSRGSWSVPPTPSLTWVEFPFAGLTEEAEPGGAANLRRIGAISVSIAAGAGSALEIDEIRVPEPRGGAGELAALAGLLLLHRARERRRIAEAAAVPAILHRSRR